MATKACVVCGTQFTVSPSNAKKRVHCSRKCQRRAPAKTRVEKVQVACKCCGEIMHLWPCHVGIKTYCSAKCRANNRKPIEITCIGCHKLFRVSESGKNKKYCSRKCRTSHAKVKVVCRQCSREYEVYRSRVRTGFCSKACRKAFHNLAITCKMCGEVFWVHRNRKNAIFCSVKCKTDHSRIGHSGPDGSLRVFHDATGYYLLQWPGGKQVGEHRYIWEKAHGPIKKGSVIHHINEDKTDNRLENLACLPRGKHVKGHLAGNKEHGRKSQEGMRKSRERQMMLLETTE